MPPSRATRRSSDMFKNPKAQPSAKRTLDLPKDKQGKKGKQAVEEDNHLFGDGAEAEDLLPRPKGKGKGKAPVETSHDESDVEGSETLDEGSSDEGSEFLQQSSGDDDDDDGLEDDEDDDDEFDDDVSEVNATAAGETAADANETTAAGDETTTDDAEPDLESFTEKQLLVQGLKKLTTLAETLAKTVTAIDRMNDPTYAAKAAKAKAKVAKAVLAEAVEEVNFRLTPSKTSLGKFRGPAMVAATKVTWKNIAKTSVSVKLHKVLGPIMDAINVSVGPEYHGSITTAFYKQMKPAVSSICRFAKCYEIAGKAFKTFCIMHGIAPRVEQKFAEAFRARLTQHYPQFKGLLEGAGDYDIEDYPYCHAFCTVIVNGEMEVFPVQWQTFVEQFLLTIPMGARVLRLWNLAYLYGVIKAKLTFVDNADGPPEYGSVDDKIWTQEKFEDIQRWLMDPDRCPTKWPALLKIRRENKNYTIGKYSLPPSPIASPA